MEFSLEDVKLILSKTPMVLQQLLVGHSDAWLLQNEGGESCNVYDVLGHLIHGEETDWLVRAEQILSAEDKRFKPFDRFAQFENSAGKSTHDLLAEFASLRQSNLSRLDELDLSKDDLDRTGIHPHFGSVTLSQLLATWAVHDLNHLHQITRIMAKQYTNAVGPWVEYLGVLSLKHK